MNLRYLLKVWIIGGEIVNSISLHHGEHKAIVGHKAVLLAEAFAGVQINVIYEFDVNAHSGERAWNAVVFLQSLDKIRSCLEIFDGLAGSLKSFSFNCFDHHHPV